VVIKARRIPAKSNPSYTSWSFPSVSQGRVIKAQNAKAHLRVPRPEQKKVAAAPLPSLKEQVVANVKAGKYVQGISARELENIVLESAKEGRKEGYAEGHRKGLKQGIEEGRKEGLDNGQAIIEDAAHRLSLLLSALNNPLAEQEAALKIAMVDAITRIATEVVRRELKTRPEVISGLVDEAVAAMPVGSTNLKISMNPDDLELLRSAGHTFDPDWDVQAAANLEHGSCRVEAGDSLVDFAQSERLNAIIGQFLDGATAS